MPTAARGDSTRLTAYEFTGRITIKQEEKGNYANIRWVKNGTGTEITLISPLGQVVAQIFDRPGAITLTLADQRQFRAEDGETLTQQVLGYAVPVSGLHYWLLGHVASGMSGEQHLRSDGLLDRLRQNGWLIQYIDYAIVDGLALPRRMTLSRDDLEIRLVIDHWTVGAEAK